MTERKKSFKPVNKTENRKTYKKYTADKTENRKNGNRKKSEKNAVDRNDKTVLKNVQPKKKTGAGGDLRCL